MRVSLFPTAFCLLLCNRAHCADPSTLFPDLARLDLKDERVRVWYAKEHAQPVKTPPAYLKDFEEAGVYVAVPLLIDLGQDLGPLALACDSGPSNDPSCRLLKKPDDPESIVFESPGTDFVFARSGEIYAFGSTDYTYDHRRLFRYDGRRFVEIRQPFRAVGIEGMTTAPLTLTAPRPGTSKLDPKDIIARLPARTPISILLNAADGDDENGQNADYLVRTREGIVGWAHIPAKPDGTTIVEGLRYNGD